MTDSNKSALVIIAHGSRLQSANDEFFQLVDGVAKTTQQFQWVLPAFLEAAQPTLADACDTAVSLGADAISVYPLFFNNGRHVGKDIPAQVADVMARHPNIDVELLDYFGSNPAMAAAIAQHLSDQSHQ